MKQKKKKPNGFWNKERCREKALKCKTKTEFSIKFRNAYRASLLNEWHSDICCHMISTQKPKRYWTKDRCHKEALKFKSRNAFFEGSPAYNPARRNGWLDDICSHMPVIKKPHNYWNDRDRCKSVALKCNGRTEFARKYPRAYDVATERGWLDGICRHMPLIGNIAKRLIYAYEFPGKAVYIGLTYNIAHRQKNRDSNQRETVTAYMRKKKLKPIRKILTDYVPIKKAVKLENSFIEKYKSKGWIILNKTKPGSIGGTTIKWTELACQKKAKKFRTRGEFAVKSASAYSAACYNGWLDNICKHMKHLIKPAGFWSKNKSNCHKEALKYKTRSQFEGKNGSAYLAAKKNGWLDEICSHMIYSKKPNYSYEIIGKEALRYKTRRDFLKNKSGMYQAAQKKGWLKKICSHMVYLRKPNNHWSYQTLRKEAAKYSSRTEFRLKGGGAYDKAYRSGVLDRVCSHMERPRK